MRTGYIITLAAGALVAAISGMSLWRATSLMQRELGVLIPQTDSLASGWESAKVPSNGRSVTFLLSDARAALDPFLIAFAPEPGFAEAAGGWAGRNLLGGAAAVETPTALARAYADSTQLIHWTHRGFSAADEKMMARELEKAILKAHDAGAVIDIVASGADAGLVLAALKRVQGLERGGVKVGANKVVFLGARAEKGASKPANVLALAYVWTTGAVGGAVQMQSFDGPRVVQMQVFDGPRAGEVLSLDDTWPGLGSDADSVDKALRLIRGLVDSPESFDALLSRQEALRRDEKAKDRSAEAKEAAAAAAREDVKAAAAADAARQARRFQKPAAGEIAKPAKTRPPEAPQNGPADGSGAGPIATRLRWPSGRLYDYSQTMNGTEIGWLFSAPGDIVENLPHERMNVSLKIPAGMTQDDCHGYLTLKAVAVRKLGPGDHDAALHALYEKENGIYRTEPLVRASVFEVHGRRAALYKRAVAPDSNSAAHFDETQLVVETGRHIIFFTMTIYSKAAVRAFCANTYAEIYQGISESIRPDDAGGPSP